MRAGFGIYLAATLIGSGASTSLAKETVTVPSAHDFAATLEKVESAAKEKGFLVFARLDHAAAAASVGQKMPPSTVVVIGNPRVGTERFIRYPTYAIDLPLRILVWQGQDGAVSITYNSASFMLGMNARHGLPSNEETERQARRTEELVSGIVNAAAR